ncbi:MAG: T9SS type A sorting domain-containing protein, partial [Bacteroidota bacterium]
FYVNGVLQGSAVVSFTQNSTKPLRFGSISDNLNYYFLGDVDEARIWNIALDSTTIQQQMHRTIDPGTSNLVGYWQFNNNSGGTAFESHGYPGVLNNFNYSGTSGWVSSTIAAAPGTSSTSSAFTSGTATMGDVSLTTTDAFDNGVNLTATVLSAIPNTVPGSYTSVIGDRYYVVNVFGQPGTFTANLTINFGASTLDSRVNSNPGGVRLYKRSSTSIGSWTLVGGAVSANSATGNVTWNGISSFSQFAAVYEESALPVELVSFQASAQKEGIELQWKTATEVNNHGFEIERRAIDNGQLKIDNWSKAGFVEGFGNSNSAHEYSFIDRITSAGKYSYRLKQIDRDGKIEYSQEVEVTLGGVPTVFALTQNYPNPFNPSTTIGFTLQVSGLTTLKVYDAIGREVATLANENLEAGVNHQRTFDASRLSSGIYFATLVSSNHTMMRKMVLIK